MAIPFTGSDYRLRRYAQLAFFEAVRSKPISFPISKKDHEMRLDHLLVSVIHTTGSLTSASAKYIHYSVRSFIGGSFRTPDKALLVKLPLTMS